MKYAIREKEYRKRYLCNSIGFDSLIENPNYINIHKFTSEKKADEYLKLFVKESNLRNLSKAISYGLFEIVEI